ncbi:pyridine nucleotide-disulfide oxidoreductase [Moorena producens PAL-8-15-08-1]|uniref:Pyridine nucleotide-disulfide oxidoreductase n=1 Tax=Moorena producens PAL-8-15-08-1 TaxID=1458985 RepID=A0A1D8TNE1_9CYAN|nr:FAD/NAD(P)-binding oxidoreductase [Moorena producens]AOW99092.1 pyridine nucleotide-disulfide oxidoreductase [Moorena producens PAL-8-15-08-1]
MSVTTETTTPVETLPESKAIQHQIVIVGGGAAGITVAAQLLTRNKALDIAIIEPSDKHYYQPGWTLVGGGVFKLEETVRDEKSCLPEGTTWIQDYGETLDPDNNMIITRKGIRVNYNYLVLCPGIQIDWHGIKGLKEALGKGSVSSNYSKDFAPYTWETIQNFKGGTAIFTQPGTPIKCAGAPQKIMYMADDVFKSKSGVGVNTQVLFCTAGGKIFAVPEYCETLEQVVDRRGIQVNFHHNLKEIKPDTQEAIFEVTKDDSVQEVSIHYDMIHVTPPMSAPDFIKNSLLAVQDGPKKGWVDVDKDTLQHNRYPNVFSLGDASSLPTSRTAAAVRGQAPVLVENLLAVINSQAQTDKYNGYTCCPLITGYNSAVMAEFDYDKNIDTSFPFNPAKERFSMWLVKRNLLPWLYWNRMLKGKPFEGKLVKAFAWKSKG